MKKLAALFLVLCLMLGCVPALADTDAFNVLVINGGVTNEEFNASPAAQNIEAYTGYKVNYIQAPSAASDVFQNLTNIFTNREDYTAMVVNKNHFYSLLAQDALADLTPYLENTTNLKEVISAFGYETASKDGKIYAIPQKDAKKSVTMALVYRQDWLDAYNAANPDAQIPVPAEENGYTMGLSNFKTMLEYFQTQVGEGGTAFYVNREDTMQENILPAFGIHQEWSEADGKLVYYVNHPNFGAYLEYMEGLYDAGLVGYQATGDYPGDADMFLNGLTGCGKVYHWTAAYLEQTEEHETDDRVGYISALVADEDFGDLDKVRLFGQEGYAYYIVAPWYASEDQLKAFIDWADKKLDKDFFLQMVLGDEGDTYTIEDGQYYPILPAFNEKLGLSDKFMTGTREEDYAQYWLCRTRKTKAQDKLFSRANLLAETNSVKSPIAVMPPNDVYDNLFGNAKSEVTNALVISMFSQDTRLDLEAIQAVWTANQGETIDEAVNTWYSTWEGKDSYNVVK